MIRAVLLDLVGVVYQGERPLPGAVDAVAEHDPQRAAELSADLPANVLAEKAAGIASSWVDMESPQTNAYELGRSRT